MSNLPNIEYKTPKRNPTIDSETSLYEIPFYKDADYFTNLDNFVTFIKGVETLVRTSEWYSRYIRYIKEDVGINFCQVLGNVRNESEEETLVIEMHHGPILTLFDYAAILIDWCLYHGEKITTFSIAQLLLEEHYRGRVQTVMLCQTVHEQVHEGTVFLNMKHAWGDLNAFIKKYRDGISNEQIAKINKYIELSMTHDSFDKHVLDVAETIKQWT